MLFGAFLGWGILSPLAKNSGWAPGPVGDWATGSRGWLVWVSLAIMLADSIISLSGILFEPAIRSVLDRKRSRGWQGDYEALPEEEEEDIPARSFGPRRRRKPDDDDIPEQDADPSFLVPMWVVAWGLVASGILCVVAIRFVFGQVPLYATVVAFFLALVLSVMGVRALGRPQRSVYCILNMLILHQVKPISTLFPAFPSSRN